jgi:hypothetical protein
MYYTIDRRDGFIVAEHANEQVAQEHAAGLNAGHPMRPYRVTQRPGDRPAAAGAVEREDHGPRAVAAFKALQVLVLDPKTRAYLRAHDPQALQQASKALDELSLQYQPEGAPDLCWYCYEVLEPTGACRSCTDAGRQLPTDAWLGLRGKQWQDDEV